MRHCASAVLATAFVCLSVYHTHKPLFYRNGCMDEAFGTEATLGLGLFYTVIRKFGYLRNKGTSLWYFVQNCVV